MLGNSVPEGIQGSKLCSPVAGPPETIGKTVLQAAACAGAVLLGQHSLFLLRRARPVWLGFVGGEWVSIACARLLVKPDSCMRGVAGCLASEQLGLDWLANGPSQQPLTPQLSAAPPERP